MEPRPNTWFLGSTQFSTLDGMSIGSAVFAQLTAERPYALEWAAPSKFSLPMGMWTPKVKGKTRVVPFFRHSVHTVKWRHSNLWLHYDLCVVGQHGVLCEVNWGGLTRYSNKIEAYDLRECPSYHFLTKKVMV